MSEIKRTISPGDRLAIFALLRLACDHYRKAREYELEMMRIAGQGDDQGCLSDLIYAGNPNPSETRFDEVLLYDGIAVADTQVD